MNEEILDLIKDNCIKASDKEYKEAYCEAVNAGYVDEGSGGWSNEPGALIAFIDGYILGSHK